MGGGCSFRAASRSSTRRAAAPRPRWSRTSAPTSRSARAPRARDRHGSAGPARQGARRRRPRARGARRSTCCSTRCSATPASTGRAPRRAGDDLPARARRASRGLDLVVANKSLALFPGWDERRRPTRPDGCARRLDAAPELARYDFVLFDAPPSFGPLTLNVLRAARRDRDAGAAHLPRARRLRRAAAHDRDGAHALRPSGAAHLDGGADLLPPHAPRARDPRAAQAALPEGDRAHGGRLPRADRRGAVARALDLRVRARATAARGCWRSSPRSSRRARPAPRGGGA